MDDSLLKKTMRTTAILLGASVAFVGTLTLVVLFLVGRAVSPGEPDTTNVGVSPTERVRDVPSVSPGASPQAAPGVAPTAPRRFGTMKSPT